MTFPCIVRPRVSSITYTSRLASLLLVAQLIAACVQSTPTHLSASECDSLLETSTHQLLASELSDTDQLVHTIATTYKIAEESVHVDRELTQTSDGERASIQWEAENRRYGIDLVGDKLKAFWIAFQGQRPKVNDLLLCLGQPTDYFAWYGVEPADAGTWLSLRLFYPALGIMADIDRVASSPQALTTASARISLDVTTLPVDAMRYSAPTASSADMLQDYLITNVLLDPNRAIDKAILAWHLEIMRPWPGELDQLEYSTLPYPALYGDPRP